MIVKVSKGDGGWFLLNDVRSIDYSSVARAARSADELRSQVESVQRSANGCSVRNALMSVDWGRFNPKGSPYKFNSLVVEHKDHTQTLVLFDHPVYLCDDAGNTVEKVNIR